MMAMHATMTPISITLTKSPPPYEITITRFHLIAANSFDNSYDINIHVNLISDV